MIMLRDALNVGGVSMIKTIVNIEGMNCNMCEEHMNQAIKQAFGVKKVASSHQKNKTIILSIDPIDRDQLEAVVTEAGFVFCGVSSEAQKKTLFSFRKH